MAHSSKQKSTNSGREAKDSDKTKDKMSKGKDKEVAKKSRGQRYEERNKNEQSRSSKSSRGDHLNKSKNKSRRTPSPIPRSSSSESSSSGDDDDDDGQRRFNLPLKRSYRNSDESEDDDASLNGVDDDAARNGIGDDATRNGIGDDAAGKGVDDAAGMDVDDQESGNGNDSYPGYEFIKEIVNPFKTISKKFVHLFHNVFKKKKLIQSEYIFAPGCFPWDNIKWRIDKLVEHSSGEGVHKDFDNDLQKVAADIFSELKASFVGRPKSIHITEMANAFVYCGHCSKVYSQYLTMKKDTSLASYPTLKEYFHSKLINQTTTERGRIKKKNGSESQELGDWTVKPGLAKNKIKRNSSTTNQDKD